MNRRVMEVEPIIAALRQDVEAQHRQVLRAIDTLADYFLRGHAIPTNGDANVLLGQIVALMRGASSVRQRVLNSIAAEAKSISEIADECDLSVKQVRGVLYAPDIRPPDGRKPSKGPSLVFKSNEGGIVRFKLRDGVDLESRRRPRNGSK